jgi:hypothetical protein
MDGHVTHVAARRARWADVAIDFKGCELGVGCGAARSELGSELAVRTGGPKGWRKDAWVSQ